MAHEATQNLVSIMKFKNWFEQQEKLLIIIRGIAGSGKSTEVDKLLKEFGVPREGHVFSTDDLISSDAEEYKSKIQKAIEGGYFAPMMFKLHKTNQERAIEAMRLGVSPIIIDNQNINRKEIEPYAQAGVIYDYEIRFVEPSSEHWQRIAPLLYNKKYNDNRIKFAALKLAAKNRHGVPYQKIYDNLKKFDPNLKPEDFAK